MLRVEAGLTQGEVAVLASVAPAYLSKVERGTHSPTPAFVAKVAAAIAHQMLEPVSSSPRMKPTR